jgi:hypothetical protein
MKLILTAAISIATLITSFLFTSFVLSQKVVQGSIIISAVALSSFKWLFAGLVMFFLVIGVLGRK